MAEYSYFLAFSTITKSALLADSSNNIENFPVQSDIPGPGYNWSEPHRELTTRPTPARVTVNADLSQSFDGFYNWQWGFKYWTFDMMQFILDNFGTADTYSTGSIPVTVQTFVDSGYQAFHANLLRPIWGAQYKSEDGGYTDIMLRFTKGVLL